MAAVKDSIPIINLGKGEIEYAVDVESDPEGYISSSSVGVIGGKSYAYAVFELAGPEPAEEIEANAVINYDTGDSEGNFVVSITGSIVPLPDFTPIVKKGEFTFNTIILIQSSCFVRPVESVFDYLIVCECRVIVHVFDVIVEYSYTIVFVPIPYVSVCGGIFNIALSNVSVTITYTVHFLF